MIISLDVLPIVGITMCMYSMEEKLISKAQ